MDSNHRSLPRRNWFVLRNSNWGVETGAAHKELFLCGAPTVRIHLPPAVSSRRDAVSGTRFAVSVGLVVHVWTNVFGQV